MGKGYLQNYEIVDGIFHVKKDVDITASIWENCHCECGWPIIHACCNDEFNNFKDADKWSWWVYCANKGCKNHDGEGVHYNQPEWIINTTTN